MLPRILLLPLFGLCLTQVSYSQETPRGEGRQQSEIVGIQTDIRTLQVEQQQIISKLDELKQLVQSSEASIHPQLPKRMDIRGANFRGSTSAPIAIIEYADFECPYCGQFEREVFPELLSEYIQNGKVKYVFRDLPLRMHSNAVPAARAARCAGEQGKYWEMHDSLFAKQNALSSPALLDRAQVLGLETTQFRNCLSSAKYVEDIQKSMSDAQQFGIEGTPTFLIGAVTADSVDIKAVIKGASPIEVFRTNLDALLSAKVQEASSGE